jgi:uncharacterized protein YlxW (UPF0749 family)
MLRTAVDLTFLALALVLITILLADRYDSANQSTVTMEIQKLREDVTSASMKNVMYLEGKINRVAESSDSYQVSTHQRIKVLEARMESLEMRNKATSRVNNTNINTINK